MKNEINKVKNDDPQRTSRSKNNCPPLGYGNVFYCLSVTETNAHTHTDPQTFSATQQQIHGQEALETVKLFIVETSLKKV